MNTKPLKDRVKEELDKRKISFLELERQTGIKANRMYKWYQQDTNPKKEDADLLENWLNGLYKSTKESGNIVEDPEVDYSQPIIQVVLNLSYTSKKNADSMDKMAATNQKNTEIIAALVGAILPNSKLANQLTSTLADLHKQDDLPVEAFLPKGTDLSKPIKEKRKEVTK